MRRVNLAIAGLLILTAPGCATPLTSETQIRTAFSGNTVSGIDEGEQYFEYYAPDGSIHGQNTKEVYSGEWRVSGSNLCMRYYEDETIVGEEKETSLSAWKCYGVDVTGSKMNWIEDGERYPAELTAGNPHRL